MYLLLVISLDLVFSLLPAPEQNARRQRNRPPSLESLTSSSRRVEICPFFRTLTVGPPVVDLLVNATGPDGDPLAYEYSVTEGKISGKGRLVVWGLENLPRGPHEARVTVTDGKGGKVDATLTVTTVDAGACDPPRPPCPVVKVSIP